MPDCNFNCDKSAACRNIRFEILYFHVFVLFKKIFLVFSLLRQALPDRGVL